MLSGFPTFEVSLLTVWKATIILAIAMFGFMVMSRVLNSFWRWRRKANKAKAAQPRAVHRLLTPETYSTTVIAEKKLSKA